MSKYKVKFKLQGLEFEIEGEKDAVPNIAQGVRNQFASLMAPVDSGSKPELREPVATGQVIEGNNRRKSPPRKGVVRASGQPTEAPALQYDPAKYGAPVQGWKAVEKALWLLRVMTDAGNTEVSGTTLCAVFEKHFRRKGNLRPSNVSRDFGKLSKEVAENTNVDPPTWYLLDAGIKHTDDLIAQALEPLEATA